MSPNKYNFDRESVTKTLWEGKLLDAVHVIPRGRISFREASSLSASQEIPRLLWTLNFRYPIYKNTYLLPI
jgi:hypothetical protein